MTTILIIATILVVLIVGVTVILAGAAMFGRFMGSNDTYAHDAFEAKFGYRPE